MSAPSIGKARYFITFIDDKTRKTFVYFLKQKSDAFEKFKLFKNAVENKTGKRVKTLRSDNGGEYTSNEFERYLEKRGIVHQKMTPYMPEQNRVAKRANQTIVEMARSMLHERQLDYEFWVEAVMTAVYLKNRNPTKALARTPEEEWSGSKLTVDHLRPFGCVAYAHVPVQKRTKLDSKTVEGIFVGYSIESKAYRIFDPKKREVNVTRDVIFDERRPLPMIATYDSVTDDASPNKDWISEPD